MEKLLIIAPCVGQSSHDQIGRCKERGYGAQAREIATELAMHFTHGRDAERALVYLQAAGLNALQRSAYHEAVQHFEQALDVLHRLPERSDRIERAIDLRFALRQALQPLGQLERILTYLEQAEKLAEGLHDQERLGQVYCHQINYYSWRGEHERAVTIGQRGLAVATALGHVRLQTAICFNVSSVHYNLGNYAQALALCHALINSVDAEHLYDRFDTQVVISVSARCNLVLCFTEQGLFAESIRYGTEGLRIAEAAGHEGSMMRICLNLGLLHLRQGNFSDATPLFEDALACCHRTNIPAWWPPIASHLGYVYAVSGRVSEGLGLLEQAVEQAIATGQMLVHTLMMMHLSMGYLSADRLGDARSWAERAFEHARVHKERGYEAWTLWLQDEIATRCGDAKLAGAEYSQRALRLAEELGMRPLQAHWYSSLGTLYSQTGRLQQAQAALVQATALYRDMAMRSWRAQAESVLMQVGGKESIEMLGRRDELR